MQFKQNHLKEGIHILHLMKQQMSSCTYHSLLQCSSSQTALTGAKLFHARIIETAFDCHHISLHNKLMNTYAKCNSLLEARKVFDQIPERNAVSWCVMIAAYARSGYGEEALALFDQMKLTSVQPNQFIFSSVITACNCLEDIREVHGEVIRSGFQCDLFVGNALVCMYAKRGSVQDARQVFNKMPQRDAVSWNAMLAGYAQRGHVGEALKIFRQMPERNVVSWTSMVAGFARNGFLKEASELFDKMPQRNVVSWTCMVSGFAQNGSVDEARRLFDKMPERNLVSWVAMIAGYAQNGKIKDALKLFQKMPERNLVSWNAVISGCVQNGRSEEALELFRQMQRQLVKPNSTTFASVLSACADLAALRQGMEIHEEVVKTGSESHLLVANALIDMYAKCGSIELGLNVFQRMTSRDVVSWNSMIAGCAIHGFAMEALKLFEQMQCSSPYPDHVTFLSVLSACCHAGLVDEGCKYLDDMIQHFQVEPVMEHHACVVDLLGRAGRLHEAKNFINKMQMKPDYIVWSCLLAACRIHNDIQLAEYVTERLIELNPEKATPYVLLSNMYAAAGRQDGVENMRKLMKDGGVKKEPRCSWIEVNNQIHAFFGGDRSHPDM